MTACRHHEDDSSCADCEPLGEIIPMRSPSALRRIAEIREKFLNPEVS